MKQNHITVLLTSLLLFSTGCTLVPNNSDGNVKPSEKTDLVRSNVTTSDQTDESLALSIFGVEISQKVIAFLGEQGAKAIEKYAARFEAKYSRRKIYDDGLSSLTPPTTPYRYTFTRTINIKTGSNVSEYIRIPVESLMPGSMTTKGGLTRIEMLRFVFDIVPSRNGTSMRIIPVSLSYQGSKALKSEVDIAGANDLSMAITVNVRNSARSPITYTAETDESALTVFEISLTDFLDDCGRPIYKTFSDDDGTDWFPGSGGGAYSVTVTALEAAKPKEWLEKGAQRLREATAEESE